MIFAICYKITPTGSNRMRLVPRSKIPHAEFQKVIMARFTGIGLGAWSITQPSKTLPAYTAHFTFSYNSRYLSYDTDAGRVYRYDTTTGQTKLVSTNPRSQAANDFSNNGSISADGRYVAFTSQATNLVTGDTNRLPDIFRKDLLTGAVEMVSTTSSGAPANGFSYGSDMTPDGRYVVFVSGANIGPGDSRYWDIYRKDLVTGETIQVSTTSRGGQPNNSSDAPEISANGRYVIFSSKATNLVSGITDGRHHLFRKDLLTGTIVQVDTDSAGSSGIGQRFGIDSSISETGRYVFFSTTANLVADGVSNPGTLYRYRKDLVTGQTLRWDAQQTSADGRYTAKVETVWGSDGTGGSTLIVTDRITGTSFTQYVGQATMEESYRAVSLSSDGRYVVVQHNFVTDGSDNEKILIDTRAAELNTAARAGRDLVLNLATADTTKITVTWGDGKISILKPSGGSARVEHAYAADGSYSVSVAASGTGPTVKYTYNVIIDTTYNPTDTANRINGTSGANIVLGSHIKDVINLGTGNDLARGGTGDDEIYGGPGTDRLYGQAGADLLDGGAGNDLLVGGAGLDKFVFRQAPNSKTNKDTITDFNVLDDTILLWNGAFKALKTGKLASSAFYAGTAAHDSSDRIIYDSKTGAIFYDADGTGKSPQVQFAQVTAGLKMSYADFLIV